MWPWQSLKVTGQGKENQTNGHIFETNKPTAAILGT